MFKVFLLLACAALPASSVSQKITSAPAGPFHISGNQIVDSKGRVFLMRGTQLTLFRPQTVVRDTRAGLDFGPHSATSLAAIRLRFNMNTVRVPVTVRDSARPDFFP